MTKKLIIGIIIITILAAAFFFGGTTPQSTPAADLKNTKALPSQQTAETVFQEVPVTTTPEHSPSSAPTVSCSLPPVPETTQASALPDPVEPQEAMVTQDKLLCSISIQCTSILNNMNLLPVEKQELVPENGWILSCTEVEFYEGESVFNVLQRTVKQYGIHMEYVNTPVYNSAYIEGIANLYEFDCGALSGWMYKVNELFPNYGCSRYQTQQGDVIELIFTCDLGNDIGGGVSAEGQFNKD